MESLLKAIHPPLFRRCLAKAAERKKVPMEITLLGANDPYRKIPERERTRGRRRLPAISVEVRSCDEIFVSSEHVLICFLSFSRPQVALQRGKAVVF
jgi:hypothetical protein